MYIQYLVIGDWLDWIAPPVLLVRNYFLYTEMRNIGIIYGSVSYCDILVVSILWLYDTYCIIHFSYTILQTIHFSLNLGYFGHSNLQISVKFVDISSFFGLKPDKMYHWYISNIASYISWYVSYHLK